MTDRKYLRWNGRMYRVGRRTEFGYMCSPVSSIGVGGEVEIRDNEPKTAEEWMAIDEAYSRANDARATSSRYYAVDGVAYRAVVAVAPDADRCVPVGGGESIIVKYQKAMWADELASAWASGEAVRLGRHEPIATVTGRLGRIDVRDTVDLGIVEIGNDDRDAGAWVTLNLPRDVAMAIGEKCAGGYRVEVYSVG